MIEIKTNYVIYFSQCFDTDHGNIDKAEIFNMPSLTASERKSGIWPIFISYFSLFPFSSSETKLLLTLIIATSWKVHHRNSAILGLPITLRMLHVKCDDSDWLRLGSSQRL